MVNMLRQLGYRRAASGVAVVVASVLFLGGLASRWKEKPQTPYKMQTNAFVKHFQQEAEQTSGEAQQNADPVYYGPLLSPKVKDIPQMDIKYPVELDGRRKETNNPFMELLVPGLVPPNVHMIWCGEQRWFVFKNYLTIKSIIQNVKPDKIVWHYEELPEMDRMFYNQWLDDVKYEYPFFSMRKMTAHQLQWCHGKVELRLKIILEMLQEEENQGAMFVGENTWMLSFKAVNRDVDLTMALDPGHTEGYLILRAGVLTQNVTHSSVMASDKYKTHTDACSPLLDIHKRGKFEPTCAIVKGGAFDYFAPSDIWELDDPFGRLSRKIFYGTEEIRLPVPTYDELVPNIGHMVWIGGGPMDFVFYLSVLSMVYVVEVDVVYIHGDKEPASDRGYWPKVKANPELAEKVKYIYRSPPFEIYQGIIPRNYRALMSDLIRVDLMIKYGGIYTDTDAIWVKGLSNEDRGYDAVASYDWVDWGMPFDDMVNFGVSYGKRNAPFWQIFRDSMRHLHNAVAGFTGVMMPYKLLEKYPHLLRIDRHLQVICYKQRCHPIWVEDYHNMTKDHITMNSIPNWREDVNALHWTHPNPPELANETVLMKSTGMFAELGKYVLQKAGLLEE